MTGYQRTARIATLPGLPEGLAGLGGLAFLIQSWISAHTQISILDEGAYLLKGYLFATGRYWPFQDYGPWTNHMPLSFLIPGWTQVVFGPGLRTGRYSAIVLNAIMLVGVWLISRRLGNRWWAAISIWVLAINAPVIKVFSVVNSQGLVACMLVWVLVLTLGPELRVWQAVLGSMLAGLLLLTRINMAPVLPLVLVYIFWQHGKKNGLWALAAGLLTIGVGHAFFWPGIMSFWAGWVPFIQKLPFIPTTKPTGSTPVWDPTVSFKSRILSFFLGIRIHFFPVVGVLLAVSMWLPKRKWRFSWRFRAAVFLLVSFGLLFALHVWASLGKNYCVFCFPNYLMFFNILGISITSIIFGSWPEFKERFGKWILVSVMVILSLGLIYGAITGGQLDQIWLSAQIKKILSWFWHIRVPRIRSMSIEDGSVELWGLLAGKFGWVEETILDWSLLIILLVITWIVVYFLARWHYRQFGNSKGSSFTPIGSLAFIFFVLGTLLSARIGFTPQETDCGWDVISAYETGSAHLAEKIPPGSSVYWRGGKSAVPLLYLPGVEIYPPQINGAYSFRLGGNTNELARHGWWNAELDALWQQDADIILLDGHQKALENPLFDETLPTPPMLPCDNNSEIHIYLRK